MKNSVLRISDLTKLSFRALALALALVAGRTLPAATVIWSGANTNVDFNWSDTANWFGGATPLDGDDVKFFDPGAAVAISNVNNIVDGSFAATIGTLQYGNTNGNHTTLIASGVTLTVTNNSALTVGTLADNASLQVNATVTGAGGTLNVSNGAALIYISQGHAANLAGTQRSTWT
jgi:hypothetical protein